MERLRTTVWPPSARLPHPGRWRVPVGVELEDGPRAAFVADYFSLREFTFDSSEVYLELSSLDLADPRSLLPFVRRYGLLRALTSDDTDDFSRVAESAHYLQRSAMSVADATNAWRVVQGEMGVDAVQWWDTPRAPQTVEDAAGKLCAFADSHLAPFHPTILVGSEREPHWSEGAESWRAWNPFSLRSLLALELFNHVADEMPYRLCANPTCRQLFVHQRGRAKTGQYRSKGVLYCSRECAKATTQRRYRQRQRQAREAA